MKFSFPLTTQTNSSCLQKRGLIASGYLKYDGDSRRVVILQNDADEKFAWRNVRQWNAVTYILEPIDFLEYAIFSLNLCPIRFHSFLDKCYIIFEHQHTGKVYKRNILLLLKEKKVKVS